MRLNRLLISLLTFVLGAGELFARTTKLHGTPVEHLKEKVRDKGKISVLVGVRLDAAFVPEGGLGEEDRRGQRDKIRKAQEKVLRKLAKLAERDVARFDSIPHMLVTVDADALDALAGDDDVVRIDDEKVLRPILADSTAQVEAPYMWNTSGIQATGAGYSVAVLDSGIQKDHPFLQQNGTTSKVISEACYSRNNSSNSWSSLCTSSQTQGLTSSTDPGSAAPCSGYGVICEHGTVIAGVAAGRNGSYQSVSFDGVAKGADIVAIKVVTLAPVGSSSIPVAFEGDLIRALLRVDAIRTSASIASVNISFAIESDTATGWPYAVTQAERASNCDGGSEDGTYPGPNPGSSHSAMYDAVATLRSNNVLVVGGTGNTRGNRVAYPACVPNFIAVGAVHKNDIPWHVSSTQGTNSGAAMDLWAPGAGFSSGGSGPGANGILSSIPGSTYAAYPGTSLAAPHVAGAIAVLKQASPSSTAQQIFEALRDSGPIVTDSLNSIGKHRLDLKRAYYRLVDSSAPSQPSLTIKTTGSTSVELTWTASTDAESPIDYYVIERRTTYSSNAEAGWTTVTTRPNADPYTYTGAAADTVSEYRVKAVNMAGRVSASNRDITAMKVFSTDLLILGQHIIDLREAANRVCTYAGASLCSQTPFPGNYTDQLTALRNENAIYAARFTDLQTSLATLRSSLGLPAITWYSPAPASSLLIKVQYLDELRNAVN